MALFEGKTPAERNKMIAAIVLPLLALVFVVRMLSGPSRPSGPSPSPTQRAKTAPRPNSAQQGAAAQPDEELVSMMTPIVCCPGPAGVGDAGRNIFAFYVKPPPPAAAAGGPTPPPPTPEPTPPVLLSGLAPQSVFARTAGFTLQVTGDKFGPAHRVYLDGQEVPTQYRSMQQLAATVPASAIASPGQRSVVVRTPDGTLFSNPAQLSVMQPPAPTYTFVGFLRRQRPSANTAVLKDAKGELYSIRQGDLVEGRFRVTDISERGVEVVDKDLNIRHTMPFVDARGVPGVAPGRAPGSIQPPPPPPAGDEEP